jgi:uncharacterized membrane protein
LQLKNITKGVKMSTTRPKSLTTIAVLLIVLSVASLTSTLFTSIFIPGTRPQGTLRENQTQGGNGQGNNGNLQGGNNFPQGNGNFQGRRNVGGFNLFSVTRALGLDAQVIRYISLGIAIIGLILLLLSAYGVWKQKRWALNLAMVLALVFLIAALPGLFAVGGRNINWLRIVLDVVNVAASAPILFLGILPSVRDFVS